MLTYLDLGMTENDFNFLMGLCGLCFMTVVTYATAKIFF